MAEVKGKFISLGIQLMAVYPDAHKLVNAIVKSKTGKDGNALDPDGWYDASLFDEVMTRYAQASSTKEMALVTLGRKIYPTIKKTVGLPPGLSAPLDFIKFEAEGFLANHRGPDVVPRKFIKANDHEVIVDAPAPGYNARLYEGVYLGILEMIGINTGKVERTSNTVFRITW
jgi:hypothetical protein